MGRSWKAKVPVYFVQAPFDNKRQLPIWMWQLNNQVGTCKEAQGVWREGPALVSIEASYQQSTTAYMTSYHCLFGPQTGSCVWVHGAIKPDYFTITSHFWKKLLKA